MSGGARPKLVVTAAMAHGYCIDFYVAEDEDMFHGASAFCEVLSRIIHKVAEICRQKGKPFPKHLWVQSDNTVAQAKNEEVAMFLAVLVGKHKFHTASLNFLAVGHTHEDVDQVFGLLLALVLRRIRFQVPQQLCEAIERGMWSVARGRGEQLRAIWLTHVRVFHPWLQDLGVCIHNCWQTRYPDRSGQHALRIEAPHSFTHKLRMDLLPSEVASLPLASNHGSEFDVFCVVHSVNTRAWTAHLHEL